MTDKDDIKRIHDMCLETAQAFQIGDTYSVARLLFGTACQESNLIHRRQLGFNNQSTIGGFSLWQLEKGSIIDSTIAILRNEKLKSKIVTFANNKNQSILTHYISECEIAGHVLPPDNILYGVTYKQYDFTACIFCRMHYLRVPEIIPASLQGQAEYWKRYYNTYLGKGKAEEFIYNYNYYSKAFS